MKYIIKILIVLTICLCVASLFIDKDEPLFISNPSQDEGEFNIDEGMPKINQTIDTIICKEMDGYVEDPQTGERCLVKWGKCDTIYEK